MRLSSSIGFVLLLLLAACELPDASRRYTVIGVDVSRYQGVIDWERLAADGHHFAFIKATEGGDHRDVSFIANWAESGRVNLRRGAYHFFSPYVDPDYQLSNYTNLVKLKPGDLPPVLDVEEIGRLTSKKLVERVNRWLSLAEAHYGVKPILYSGQNFYNRHLAGQFDDYPLWLARYGNEEPVTICGRSFDFWQYTDRGHLPGVVGDIDRNVFLGTSLELAALCVPASSNDEQNIARSKK